MKTKAVGYCRAAGKGKAAETERERQEQGIRLYEWINGYNLSKVYHEASTETGPVFESMIANLLSGDCRTIIIDSLDTLNPDLFEQQRIVATMTSQGITLIDSSTGKDGVSQINKALLLARLKKGRDAKREQAGRCEGRKPFGYLPGEDDTIARIKQLYRKRPGDDRLTCYRIAKILNRENRPTRTGCKWQSCTVNKILERLNILK